MDGVEKQQQLFSDIDDTCAASGESVDGDSTAVTKVTKPADVTEAGEVQKVEPGPAVSDSAEDEVVYVIDSFSLIYQVFFGIPSMTGPAGQPVNAIYGFVRDIADLLKRKTPTHIIAVFDAPGDVFRHALYPAYKENRDPMPDDLRAQIPPIKRMLEAMGIRCLELVGFEADDIMATLAEQSDVRGNKCYLVTSDKDCRQLLSDNVQMYNIRKDSYFDADDLHKVWGVRPDQVVDFQSLVGDSVDNVPGVNQIGPKTATTLLQEFDTLEAVLDNAETVKAKNRRENLMNGREDAMLSRKLVRLDRNVPIEFEWLSAVVSDVDAEQVETLCDEFGFRTLRERLLSAQTKPTAAVWEVEYVTITSLGQLENVLGEITSEHVLSIDTETTGLDSRSADLVGYSFAWEVGKAYYVPVRSMDGDVQLDGAAVRELMCGVLEDPTIRKVGQNLKYDMVVLRNHGIQLAGLFVDTMVAHYLIEPDQRNHSLDFLSECYLQHKPVSYETLAGKGKKQVTLDQVPLEKVAYYAAEDADIPLRLYETLVQQLEEKELLTLFQEVEMPLIEVLAELEYNGICVNVELLKTMSVRFAARIEELTSEIFAAAEQEFNIDSPKQLSKVLFEDMGLPVIKKTKTGLSTDAGVLNELTRMGVSDLPPLILEYRQVTKLKRTYVDALPEMLNTITGKVHSAFKQDVAATGRLSSTDPNLQNIPIRTAEGREIRSAFIPSEEGWKLLAADYSQVELRVLAHFSQDETLQQAFIDDEDIHSNVAAEVYDVPVDEVTVEMRRGAKAVNFGVIYGQSAFGLAKALGIENSAAAEFIDSYFRQYPGVEAFMLDTLRAAHRDRRVSTILGRHRNVADVRDPETLKDKRQRNLAERIAINTVIQGSAADIIKVAMIAVLDRLKTDDFQARLLLQIHDELVFEVAAEEVERLTAMVREEMMSAVVLSVPLKVDICVGDNWAQCK
ncbi:MAG TPA: DNA polymerase I [Planctomycetes bacterium]|nr:DNA polymerase I [Planctomycetota bacterium]